MFSTLVTLLVLFNQVLLNHLAQSAIEHSSERLQAAIGSMCELRKLYDEHKDTHGHSRPANEEYGRMKLFLEEIKEILEMRSNKDITWDVGLHFMADMSDTEKASMRGTVSQSNTTAKTLQNTEILESKLSVFNTPEKFDEWRNNDMIGPSHQQKKGSCWAHSAVVPLEAQLAFYKGTFRQLSVQELYRCTYRDKLLNDGGVTKHGWQHIINDKRLGYWADSPEKTDSWLSILWRDNCKDYQKTPNALDGYKIASYGKVLDEEDLRNKVACIGPVTFGIDSRNTKLDNYMGGTFKPIAADCRIMDHAMVVVGYTRWVYIIKNSWGRRWGEDGYLMLSRKGPECQMFLRAEYVILEPTIGTAKVCKWDQLSP